VTNNAFDAIVVGARRAGSPTLTLLARKGYRVSLTRTTKITAAFCFAVFGVRIAEQAFADGRASYAVSQASPQTRTGEGLSQEKKRMTAIEQDLAELRALNAKFIHNYVTRDVAAHDAITHERFVNISPSGRYLQKVEYLKLS
jgi:hypothetical protein